MTDFDKAIESQLRESADVKLGMIRQCTPAIARIANLTADCLEAGGRLFLCGNGGSAADAQHIAAELVSKLRAKRSPLPAISLTTNTSILTAVGNDWSFEEVFARQIEALGKKGDVLIAISTSGESKNVLHAVDRARAIGMLAIGFAGAGKCSIDSHVDVCLKIPSRDIARIQEGHIVAGHIICNLIERATLGGRILENDPH